MRVRRLVPEVVQTSAMDCGPACLASVLRGFGIHANYEPLRDACQTDVDGTSIDAIEELATRLGLNAEQIVIPVDHVLLDNADALPAIVVITAPSGFTHFVVVWNIVGGMVQVMDPAIGRRWIRRERFLSDVFVHEQAVPAAAWQEWSRSEEFRGPLRRRLQLLGVSDQRFLAVNDSGWQGIARIDAAARMVAALIEGGALAPGDAAASTLTSLIADADSMLLEQWGSVRPGADNSSYDEEHVLIRGAVLVRVSRPSVPAATSSSDAMSAELRAALSERQPSPLAELFRVLRADGWMRPATLLGALALATIGVLVEALVLRSMVDLAHDLALPQQRWAVATGLALLLVTLLALELPIGLGILGMARRLEIRFRTALLQRIPMLGDRYFGTRPLSDMAERAHAVHQLRTIGDAGWTFCRAGFELVMVSIGLVLLWPQGWPLVVALAAISAGLPFLANAPLRERDLRARTHLGALSRFYLDALLGLVAVNAHGAERALQREHESLLVEWVRASRARLHVIVASEAVQLALGLAIGAFIAYRYLAQSPTTAGVLLLAYWAFRVPTLGEEIALVLRRYPMQRSIALRLMEPLTVRTDGDAAVSVTAEAVGAPSAEPVAVELNSVSVVIGGNTILRDVTLSVPAGAHVAIVGPSGAGKSTLLALVLGWLRPNAGEVLVGGRQLFGAHLDAIRQRTAWSDPSVQLWNRTLLQNLTYGSGSGAVEGLAGAIDDADLRSLLQQLPNGMATVLGEGGALVSGGEGQRVRLARAFLRNDTGLVVLDEPFRGLDHSARDAALARLRERFPAATILLATHEVGATRGFERVLVMDEGEIVEDGAPSALAARPSSRYARLLEADRRTRERMWRSGAWRRLRLNDGIIIEPDVSVPLRGTGVEGSRWTA